MSAVRRQRDREVVRTPPSVIALATEMILRSGALLRCELLFAGRPGPNRRISWLGLLVTLQIATRHKVFRFENMINIYLGFPERVRRRFEPHSTSALQLTGPKYDASVRDAIHRAWDDLCYELNSSPLIRPYPDPEHRRRIYETRIELCDALASGWLPSIPHDAHVEDGTALDGHRNKRLCGDPDARSGHRTSTDRDPRDSVYGFTLCAMLPGATSQVRPPPPFVVLRHELAPANELEGEVALRLYARHAATCDIRWAIGDPFVSHAPLDFSVSMLRLGGLPVHDLHELELGQRGMALGFLTIDSWLWYPDLASEYWRLHYTPRNRLPGEYRSHFACQHLSGPTPEHVDQVLLGCPGRSYGTTQPATLKCPRSAQRSGDVVADAPEVGKCVKSEVCTAPDGVWVDLVDEQGTPTRIGRAYQELPRLSPAWYSIYGPLRAHVENAFSTITTPNGANLGERAHQISGLPGTALWVGCGLSLHNHHRVARWLRSDEVQECLEPAVREAFEVDPLFAGRSALEQHFERLFQKV